MDLGQLRFWEKNKRLLVVSFIIIIGASVVGLIFAGYWMNWTWTGFDKTLWDWMQLLIIPVALGLGAFLLNRSDQGREQAIALDNQRETLFQAYLDRMSELLLEKNLRASQPDDEVRTVARARTLTMLPRLDPGRKKSVADFLSDSNLLFLINLDYADLSGITYGNVRPLDNFTLNHANCSHTKFCNVEGENITLKNTNFSWATLSHVKAPHANLQQSYFCHAHLSHVDLRDSNLTNVNLQETYLEHVILSNANLSEADLRGAKLSNTDLSNADLRRANLSNVDFRTTNLQGANLSGANLNGAKFRHGSNG
jgi:uncharacterized protein YjbI with pentapeptide repeats